MTAAMEFNKENASDSSSSMVMSGGKNGTVRGSAAAVSSDSNPEAFSPELLRLYYARLFPYQEARVLAQLFSFTHIHLVNRSVHPPEGPVTFLPSVFALKLVSVRYSSLMRMAPAPCYVTIFVSSPPSERHSWVHTSTTSDVPRRLTW